MPSSTSVKKCLWIRLIFFATASLASASAMLCDHLLGRDLSFYKVLSIIVLSLMIAAISFVFFEMQVQRLGGMSLLQLLDSIRALTSKNWGALLTWEESARGSVGSSIRGVTDRVQTLTKSAQEGAERLNTGIEQLSASANEILFNSQMQAATVNEARELMADMTRHIEKVSVLAQETETHSRHAAELTASGESSMDEALHEIHEVSLAMNCASRQIHTLLAHAEDIDKIAATIKEIANKTNLLALNAAIEAASAGAAGKGFNVVAIEVRALSSRTHDATREIAATIQLIQQQTRSTVAAIEETMAMLDSGERKAGMAAGHLHEIHTETQETLERISSLVTQANEQKEIATTVVSDVSSVLDMAGQTDEVAERTTQTTVLLSEVAAQLAAASRNEVLTGNSTL